MKKPIVKTLSILALSLLLSPVVHADVALTFGLYASDKPSEMVKMFQPSLRALALKMQAQLGEPVRIKLKVAKTYEQGLDNLVTGAVDFSQFGPASYIAAKEQQPELTLLAMEAKDNDKVFYGIIAVAADSKIQTVEELKGKRFAFGAESSTIGRYLSQLLLIESGVQASDLAAYEYLGRHDIVGEAVAAGLYDAGALKEGTFKKQVKAGKALRELARFPNVTKPWIARKGLPERQIQALRQGLLDMDEPKALSALKVSGFLPGLDSDYDTIRQSIARNAEFFQ